ARRARLEVHALLRPAQGRQGAGLRPGVSHRLDPVRRARRAARPRGRAPRAADRGGSGQRAAVSRRRERWDPGRGRVLPAARRARGLRPAARPGRSRPRPRLDLGSSRRRGARAGRGDRRRDARRPAVSKAASYYGRPILKEPVWTPEIPIYFFAGGMAGAAAAAAWLAEIRGNDDLARRAWLVALGGATASPALLISDLGRPARFLNMLRMFKVTSPMSVGSWILAGAGTTIAP